MNGASDPDTRVYYGRRADHARLLARKAANSSIAAIHREMAERYEELATGRATASSINFPSLETRHGR